MNPISFKDVVQQEIIADAPIATARERMRVEHPSQIYTLLDKLKIKTHEQQHTWQLLEQAVQESLIQAKRYYDAFGILDGMTHPKALSNTFVKYAKLETPSGSILTATHMGQMPETVDKDGLSNPNLNPEEAPEEES